MHVVLLGASSMGLQFEEDYEDDAADADESSHEDDADDADKDQLRCSLRRLRKNTRHWKTVSKLHSKSKERPLEQLTSGKTGACTCRCN